MSYQWYRRDLPVQKAGNIPCVDHLKDYDATHALPVKLGFSVDVPDVEMSVVPLEHLVRITLRLKVNDRL